MAEKFRYIAASGMADVGFPLTPALSLGERGNRRQSVGESETVGTRERYARGLPLPKGEGRGEGEQAAHAQTTSDVSKLICRANNGCFPHSCKICVLVNQTEAAVAEFIVR